MMPLPPPSPHARARARLLLFGSAVCFGLAAVFTRIATRAPDGMSGGQATLVRFVLGVALVIGLFVARPGTFRPVRYGLLASRGALGGLAALLYFLSLARISAGEATLLNNTFPIFAVLLSFLFLEERPTLHLAVALAIASAGVLLVLGGGATTFGLGPGELLGILSGVIGGAAVTSIRALRQTDNAPTIFLAFALGGLLFSLPYALDPFHAGPAAWAAALGTGAVAFLAQLFMTEAYGALSVAEAALWQQLTPIASYLCGIAIGERVTVATCLGVLLGVGGIVYGSLLGHRPRAAAPVPEGLASGLSAEDR